MEPVNQSQEKPQGAFDLPLPGRSFSVRDMDHNFTFI